MEIIQILFGKFLGFNRRYYFIKLYKRDFVKENEKDLGKIIQGIYNVIVGFVVLILIFFGTAYMVF